MPHRHSRNPLRQPEHPAYFGMARREVIRSIQSYGTRAGRIIELGCGGGETGAELKQALGAEQYVGVEIHEPAAERARQRLDRVIIADLQKQSFGDLGLREGEFDLLVALDVLEHLYDPWETLAQWARVVRPGGRVVLSIPNTQNLEVVAALAHGRWQYTSAGLLDVTHIRFFTADSVADLVTGAGLSIVAIDMVMSPGVNPGQVRETGNQISAGKLTLKDLTRQEVLRLAVWQFIVIADVPEAPAEPPITGSGG